VTYRLRAGGSRAALGAWLVASSLSWVGCMGDEAPDGDVDPDTEAIPLFNNGDFESGTLASWTTTTFLNNTGLSVVPPTTTAQLQLSNGGDNFTFARMNATPQSQVPPGLTAAPGVPRWPRFGTTSAVINEYGTNIPPGRTWHQGANNNVNSLKQSMATTFADVDPSDGKVHVRFVLAPQLEAAGHTPAQQPYFFVVIRNLTPPRQGDLYTSFNFSNQPGVPWQSQGSGASALLFTDWQIFDIAPTEDRFQVGDTLEVETYAAGCEPGGHSGTVYVDGFGAALPSLAISKTAPAVANVNSDITYTFTVQNNTSGIAPNVVADEVLPPHTTFVSLNAPGASCTTPAVGATGTVRCTYGWMNPGASATFQVTVRNHPPAAQGTATAGTNNSLTMTGAGWTANQWRGYTAYITGGQGAGQQRTIIANTATQLTIAPNWTTNPNATSTFIIINPPVATGTATAGTNNTLTDALGGWTSNRFLGQTVTITSGTGAGQQRIITMNSATQLTVNPNWGTNPNATSTYAIGTPVDRIVNGDYGVTGPTVSRLLGPKRETALTSGVVYTDLAISNSNGVAGVDWGGSLTYTITVVNNGPSAVSNALVTDTFPAQLATHTWTCAGAAGGSCDTASGNGDLNHTVDLPVGGRATFTVNATVVAGTGIGTLSNLATVAAPAGVTDNFLDNNSDRDQDGIGRLFALTVNKHPGGNGQGTVTSQPAVIDCGPACTTQTASFVDTTVVTLRAVAVPFNRFEGWSGACAGTSATCTVTMTQARTVTARFTACGNGTLDAGEGCDDGNALNGDGCTNACLVENTRPCNATAPGLTGDASCASGLCDMTSGAPGVCEPVGCGDGRLAADEGCDDGNTVAGDGCSAMCLVENSRPCNAASPGLTGDASCASGICDATGGAPGVCEPVGCGNGRLEAGEGCDDGGTVAGDGCSATCRVEDGRACNVTAPGTIGDASCASGICDTTGGAPGVCEPAGCGNGRLEAGEGCDDGGTAAGDGCNAVCLVENGDACNATAPGATGDASCASGICDATGGAPGVCEPMGCGNGRLEAGEGCDDGGTVAGDGCNSACKVEDTFACNATAPGATGNASCASNRCDTSGGAPGVCVGRDTDGDGVTDGNDLDDDNDGILDVEEGDGAVDTDGDGVPDSLDLDSDNDGILDVTEAGHFLGDDDSDGEIDCPGGFGANGLCDDLETAPESGLPDYDDDGTADGDPRDTDGDGVDDYRDLDSDDDGLADVLEAGHHLGDPDGNAILDCPGGVGANGLCDALETTPDSGAPDYDDDGVAGGDPRDTDGDGVDDYRDLDSDDDGLSDLIEGGSGCADANADSVCDGADPDGDGIRESADGAPGVRGDAGAAAPPNTDGRGPPDYRDLDSDDDGISDLVEGGSGCTDANDDGVCDGGDDDGDGIRASADGAPGTFGDGGVRPPTQSDDDGIPDFRDLDSDGDRIPDVVEGGRGDLDRDGDGVIDDARDEDGDGILDVVDDLPGVFGGLSDPGRDADGDDLPDFQDADSDNDGLIDGAGVSGGGCSAGGTVGGLPLALALLVLAGLVRARRRAVPVVLALTAGVAAADERGFPVERFRLSADAGGLLDVEGATALERHAWSVSLWLGASDDPLVVYDLMDGDRERTSRLVDTRLGGDLAISYGVTRWLELSLAAPLVVYQDRDTVSDVAVGGMLEPIGSYGLGNVRLAPKLRVLRQGDHGVDLAVIPAVVLPTSSSDDDYLGDTAFAVAPELAIGRRLGRLRLGANLGYRSRPRAQVANLVVDDELFAHVGAGVMVSDGLEWALTSSLATAASDPLATFNQNHAELLTGPTFHLDRLQVIAAAGVGAAEGFGTPDMRVLVGARYASPARPVAARPVVDKVVTPPDLDADDDGVLDADDRCPREAGPVENAGCPDVDTDGDGLVDRLDQCVSEPEDADGFADEDGCPDLDDDGDGLADAVDACPREPGPEANRGCPDTDRDGDTVVDRLDTCPDEPGEVKHGGCKRKPMATITEGKIAIVDTVYFKLDKAIIEKRSYKLLESVAGVLSAHEGIRVRIEGHTDSQGNDAYNKDLSQRRAEAVRAFLVGKGIDEARLDAVGFGEEQPVQDNRTRAGRAANRRVEFVIVDASGVDVRSQSSGPGEDTVEPLR